MKPYYSTHEAAKMCHVSPGTMIRWIHEGRLPAAMTAGGHRRVRHEDLIALLERLRMAIPDELRLPGGSEGEIRVLIVDDDRQILGLLTAFFEKSFPAVKIYQTSEGFHAGMMIQHIRPKLIVLDINIPNVDGYRVCEVIRKRAEFKSTRILVISGNAEQEVAQKVLRLGADHFLPKPIELGELRKVVSHLLGPDASSEERRIA